MSVWSLQPRDPLMARDGKPFSAAAGAKARSLPLPPPSMLAGAWRSWLGRDAQGQFDPAQVDAVLAHSVLGPLLQVQGAAAGAPWEALAPVPLDAFPEGDADGLKVTKWHRLAPKPVSTWGSEALCDLDESALQPVAFKEEGPRAKPAKQVAPYWRWSAFLAWLEGQEASVAHSPQHQVQGPVAEGRLHVGLKVGTRVSDEGALFFTESRAYEGKGPEGEPLRYALGFSTSASGGQSGSMAVGGERRLATWCQEGAWPGPSEKVLARIAESGRARLVLLSPAAFDAGWKPHWALSGAVAGVQGQVVAAAVGRPTVVSGWRLDPEGGPGAPKPTRRLAPAASVYWVELSGDAASRRAWAEALWLQSLSDQAQDRLDGFGLAVLGVWEA